MIVSRTPLRISFFGGGTDFPEYFNRNRGAVIGMAIDKHVYVTAMRLSPIHPYRYRLYWSKIERCMSVDEIEHPVVRSVLSDMKITQPLGFSIIADLPARNGLGSSSAFTVGFLSAVMKVLGYNYPSPLHASGAIRIEREILKEAGGWQDQWICAEGGLRRWDFALDGVDSRRMLMADGCESALTSSLFLVHGNGKARNSWEVNAEQIERTTDHRNDDHLEAMLRLVDYAETVLTDPNPNTMLGGFGALLHEGWRLKKKLSRQISNPKIDELYAAAMASGALGGKLCGAGGSGFLVVLVPPENQKRFREMMRNVAILPVGIDNVGSTIIHSEAARYD